MMSTLIGGPAARRTDTQQINIWIALSLNAEISAMAFEKPGGEPIAKIGEGSDAPVKMGQNLYFYLLKLVPTDPNGFPDNSKIYYDITIDGKSLNKLGLTSGDTPITYPGEELPSLIIPKKHQHIVQGSCRKPHAANKRKEVQRDQFTRIDSLIEQNCNDHGQRPSMIVLTGDQIYADDVATPLLAALNKTGAELTGISEKLPAYKKRKGLTDPSAIKLHNRHKVLNKKSGFTSGHGHNQLMTFGEFCSMYLAVWGGKTPTLPSWDEAKTSIPWRRGRRAGQKGPNPKVYDVRKQDYEGEKIRVDDFLSGCWKARRAMANTPTYMMFDDHEVTDDWNLTLDTQEALAKNGSIGRRLSANALAAYWVCQGWGNNPDAFDDKFKRTISEHFATQADDKNAKSTEELLLSENWSYSVPGYPALIAIDTRTDRTYAEENGRPKLMSNRGFEWLQQQMVEFGKTHSGESDQSLIVLSPAPVFGFKQMEILQEKAIKNFKMPESAVDSEYWSANEDTLARFLKTLDDYAFTTDIIFLSGDVHYSYCAIDNDEVAETEGRYFQLTSSALCNHPTPTQAMVMKWIESNMKAPGMAYLLAKGQDRVVNGHNSTGSIFLKNGLPVEAEFHFYDPKKKADYSWVYDLKKPNIRPT